MRRRRRLRRPPHCSRHPRPRQTRRLHRPYRHILLAPHSTSAYPRPHRQHCRLWRHIETPRLTHRRQTRGRTLHSQRDLSQLPLHLRRRTWPGRRSIKPCRWQDSYHTRHRRTLPPKRRQMYLAGNPRRSPGRRSQPYLLRGRLCRRTCRERSARRKVHACQSHPKCFRCLQDWSLRWCYRLRPTQPSSDTLDLHRR